MKGFTIMALKSSNDEYNYKKSKFLIAVLTIIILAVFIIAFLNLNSQINKLSVKINEIEQQPVFKEEPSIPQDEKNIYSIKDINGRIFALENEEIIEDLGIITATLTEKEKKLLQQGVSTSSLQELNEIISCFY